MDNQKIMDNQTFTHVINTIKRKKRKTEVAPTSVDAYEAYKHNEEQVIADKRLTHKDRIVEFIKENPGCTREQIAEGTGIKLQTVTGNVTQLLRKCRIEERGTTLNRSGRKVGQLWPVSE